MIRKMNKPIIIFLLCSSFFLLCEANEANHLLHRMLTTRGISQSFSVQDSWTKEETAVFIAPQDGLMESDKIDKLPGQPDNVDFDQYAGYVTVDPKAGRALFYYFVESPSNSSTNPLVLWLSGGPRCSSLGLGAMLELGPFRVNRDNKTLFRNDYAWNNVANVIFLESPAGVGFSYSNTTADYNNTGDATTADDSYAFLVNWLERFPQYKTRDFYISGDSYAGHYAPQLARVISINNQNTNLTVINLKGIAIGNALVDDVMIFGAGSYDHRWAHALNSDETHRDIHRYCDFSDVTSSLDDDRCRTATLKSDEEMGWIDRDNIYAPQCRKSSSLDDDSSAGSINFFDPCSDSYVLSYLNNAEVQKALHVNPTRWTFCNVNSTWKDWEIHVLPTIEHLISIGIRVWLYSGDVDATVPVTSTRYVINSLKLPIESSWRPWYHADEVAGYVVGYKGLTFVTVRGAGHLVPWYQPQRALTMIASFLQGVYPPPSSSS